MDAKDFGKNKFNMLRTAIVYNVRDRQPWPAQTPSKIRVAKSEEVASSKDSPLADEMQEMKAILNKLVQATCNNGKPSTRKEKGDAGLRRSPEPTDDKACAWHCYVAGKTIADDKSYTNAAYKMRDASFRFYKKSHDEAVKRFLKK
jgi:hypothetical protein